MQVHYETHLDMGAIGSQRVTTMGSVIDTGDHGPNRYWVIVDSVRWHGYDIYPMLSHDLRNEIELALINTYERAARQAALIQSSYPEAA